MNSSEFRRHAHALVDWMADYIDGLESRPVHSDLKPGDVLNQLPRQGPESGESMDTILDDFRQHIVPGMTHWQHPMFMGYFPANSSWPAVLAQMLMATLGAQCMSWETSPAATELEQRVMEWLRDWLGLPEDFVGVTQDTASTATLCAVLAARERASGFAINEQGLRNTDQPLYTVYCSNQAHSSVEKALRIAGLGSAQLRQLPVDEGFALRVDALEAAVNEDKAAGLQPLMVVAALGTTSSTAIDPIEDIGQLCQRHDLWLHVDAAYAGAALLLPEYRWMLGSAAHVDSLVMNPHKWLGVNFDCSALFLRDAESLVRTFSMEPEYLRTGQDGQVNNYRDWGVQLGRPFRALKLWFVLRSEGLEGLQNRLRAHIAHGQWLKEQIDAHPDFERLAPAPLNCVCFRWRPAGVDDEAGLEAANQQLLAALKADGRLYLTHTRLGERYALRLVPGQTRVERRHVELAWQQILEQARLLHDEV